VFVVDTLERTKMVELPVQIQEQTYAGVHQRVGEGQFSEYVDAAVRRQLQRDAVSDLLDRMESQHGEPDLDRVAKLRAKLGW